MRVLHINTEKGWRGGERQTILTLAGLRERRVAAALIAQPGSPLFEGAVENRIPVCPLRMRGPLDVVAAWRLSVIARTKGVEVMHLQTAHAAALALLACLFRCKAKKVVSRRVDFPIRSAWKYNRFDAVAAISKAVRDVLISRGVVEEILRVIPSGIPVAVEKPADTESFRRETAKGARFLVASVGRLAAHKGHRYLIEALPRALAREPSITVAIIGDGELRTELERRARELDLAERVVFTGFRHDVLEIMWSLDLLVMPSLSEGLCTTLLDAMVRGVPIVATTVGGMPEVLDGGRFGLLAPPADPNALADAIVAALHDDAARKAMTNGADRWVRDNYSADVMVEKTLELYQNLVS